MSKIHPTAIIDINANLGENVEIGAYSVIGQNVTIGNDCVILPHVTMSGRAVFGDRNVFHSGAVVGAAPQDKKYAGEDTELIVGNDNVFRECVTLNRGTTATGKTIIGDNNLMMAYVHIAHDCIIGSNIIMANLVNLGGHVEVHNNAIIGGINAIHQFVRIGSYAMVGAGSKVVRDVLPYSLTDGTPLRCAGLNNIGLKRNGFDTKLITQLKECFKIIYFSKISIPKAVIEIEKLAEKNEKLSYLLEFIKASQRGITPRK